MSAEPVDVVIVGAGPTGAVAALHLIQAGLSVVCLEQGAEFDYGLAQADRPEWELVKDRWFAWNPNRRKGEHDYPINDADSSVAPLMWNGLGGSSVLYAAAWHRLKPSDFRVRTLDGVAADWPISYSDLVPYYERVERDFAVSGLGGDPAYPPGLEYDMPPFGLSDMDRRLAAAHDRLGWHWWPGSNAIATQRFGALRPCVRRGACMWGCVDSAKASVDRSHWPRARALGVELRLRSRVLRIETDRDGRATGVIWTERGSGVEQFQAARTVVVAANGVGTPRLLLNSSSTRHPDGLGNSSGLVGRNLMMHPHATAVGLFDDFFESWQGPTGQRSYSLEFSETGSDRDHVRGAKWQLMGTGGPFNVVGSFPFGGEGAWGPQFHDTVRQRFGHSAVWSIVSEDLPLLENRVELDETLVDADGMPAPKITYRTSENSRRLLRFHEQKASESLLEAGAYDVVIAPGLRETGWHLLGTARMGDDPACSVVDRWNRLHDAQNVLVIDGSVMPTSSCVNPTGTVVALALRAAESLVRRDVGAPLEPAMTP